MTDTNSDNTASILGALRSLIPNRRLRFSEALHIAELQAAKLLEITLVHEYPVPSEIVSNLSRIKVDLESMPTSGASDWDGQTWHILINEAEAVTRRRFTLFHEFKHIIDHNHQAVMYADDCGNTRGERAEQAAEYFAGCVLMPKRFIEQARADGIESAAVLARCFDVSPAAMSVRLSQLGLLHGGRGGPDHPRHGAI